MAEPIGSPKVKSVYFADVKFIVTSIFGKAERTKVDVNQDDESSNIIIDTRRTFLAYDYLTKLQAKLKELDDDFFLYIEVNKRRQIRITIVNHKVHIRQFAKELK